MNRKNTSKHHKEMKEVKMKGNYKVKHLRLVFLPMVIKRYSRVKIKGSNLDILWHG